MLHPRVFMSSEGRCVCNGEWEELHNTTHEDVCICHTPLTSATHVQHTCALIINARCNTSLHLIYTSFMWSTLAGTLLYMCQ